MKIKKQNSGYTILVTLMITGFLMVLTTGILNLVLRELNDNRGALNYLKAFAGAEAAQELALLQIKKYSYGVYDKIDFSSDKAKILRDNKNDKKEILISYNLNSKTKSYTGILDSYEQAVIPLFYIKTDNTKHKIKNLKLNILNSFSDKTKMAWNIVSKNGDGIGGNNEINYSTKAKGRKFDGKFLDEISISGSNGFLDKFDDNYLIVINLDPSNKLEFNLTSNNEFTKPISKIISQAKIGKYKQNLETTLDNTAFLSILKYSVYSN